MKLFEGKSPTERNKIIAAMVLGVMCVVVLAFVFGPGLFSSGSTTTVAVKVSPTPKTADVPVNPRDFELPSQSDQDLYNMSVPINYVPSKFGAPGPGRNIFAFYEPPPPCTDCPTPTPVPIVIPPPTPTPEPDILLAFMQPTSVYAGSKTFRLEIAGDRFTPDSRIYFSQTEMPTTFISAQKLITDIPAGLVNGEGQRQVIVQTVDGRLHSNQIMLQVQAPPKPQFQYIGMITRKRSNNDTAYFLEAGKPTPVSARLNDVVMGRFRLLSISEQETILEDVGLGFKHKLPIFLPAPGTPTTGSGATRGGFQGGRESYVPFNPPMPAMPNSNTNTMGIPGIPDNIPRYTPPPSNRQPSPTKQNADDDEDGDN